MRNLFFLLIALCVSGCGNNNANSEPPTIPNASHAWGTAVLLETNNAGHASDPQVAVDPYGNAVAVWTQSNGINYNIWANRYNASIGSWSNAELIQENSLENALAPQVSVKASGDAIAVWQQSDGTNTHIWSNMYSVANGTWSTAIQLEANSGDAITPRITIDTDGNAIVVWAQYDGTTYSHIWSIRYLATSGTWDTAIQIEANSGHAGAPVVAVDSSGNAIAVWYQDNGGHYNIYTNRYAALTGNWGVSSLIETNIAEDAVLPQIAVDSSGNAIVVWQQYDGTRYSIWANRYTAAAGTWGAAALLETDDTGDADSPQIAFDSSGNALVVWGQKDSTRYHIWSKRFYAATGTWGSSVQIESNTTGNAVLPQIAIDGTGNAVVVWYQYNGTRNSIWSIRYAAATATWGAAVQIETNIGDADSPQVKSTSSGKICAVWRQINGTANIWANTYH